MSRHGSNPRELRGRAVRMVAAVKDHYPSEQAMAAVPSKLGVGSAETLQVGSAERGRRPVSGRG